LRSLADFAKIVGVLDARNASFVSVTQYQDYSGDHKNRKYAAVSRGFVAGAGGFEPPHGPDGKRSDPLNRL
jgi:hypothetical protein